LLEVAARKGQLLLTVAHLMTWYPEARAQIQQAEDT